MSADRYLIHACVAVMRVAGAGIRSAIHHSFVHSILSGRCSLLPPWQCVSGFVAHSAGIVRQMLWKVTLAGRNENKILQKESLSRKLIKNV